MTQQQTTQISALPTTIRYGEDEEMIRVGCSGFVWLWDRRWTMLVLVIVGLMSLVACKDPGHEGFTQLKSEGCLLDEVIRSLEINVEVPDPQQGYLDFDYVFADQTPSPGQLPGFKVPFLASAQQTVTVEDSNKAGIDVVGHQLSQGLIVKERIRLLRAEYTSECQLTTDLSSASPFQNHTITVLVNGRAIIESEFEITPEQVTDGCDAGQSARKVVLEIMDLQSNQTFAQRRNECPGGVPAVSTSGV